MLNMSNQFYNYLKDRLVEFLYNQPLKGGERFYVQFDEDIQVEIFYNVLRCADESRDFIYKHDQGSLYNTFELNINGISVVIAATVNKITPDFLVALRNEVETQKHQWKDKAIIFIYNENLDSIKYGSSNLLKEGMPFHVKTITKNLSKEINRSELNKAEKKVVDFYLQLKLADKIMQPTLWEFSEILSLVSRGNIQDEDYSKLGLFRDDKLIQYTPNQMDARLKENYEFYKDVESIHEFGNIDYKLEKLFDDNGVKRLKSNKWKEQDFTFVKESNEKNKSGKVLEYIEDIKKVTEDNLVFWEKPYTDTKAGARKRHIIIFNPLGLENIKINFTFDDFIQTQFLNKKSAKVCQISGKKLKVNLIHKKGEVTFKKITYTHKKQSKSKYEFNIAVLEVAPELLKEIKTVVEVNESKRRVIINNDNQTICIGDNENYKVIDELGDINTIEINSLTESLKLPSTTLSFIEDEIQLDLKIDKHQIPLLIKNKAFKAATIPPKRVWKLKREYKENFIINNNKLKQGTREFYPNYKLNKIIEDENTWISNKFFYGERKGDKLEAVELELDSELKKAYLELLNYYRDNEFIPILTYMGEELKLLCENYIDIFNRCIENISENALLSRKEKDLSKIGVIKEDKRVILTPLHPLNIAYQLSIYSYIDEEVLEYHILDRLNGANLLPYMFLDSGELYRAVAQNDISEWIIYEPLNNVRTQDTNSFLADVIEEKLKQFVKYFNYLFIEGSKAPLKINMVNIGYKKEIIRGIFVFIKKQIKEKGPDNIIPMEIGLYQDDETENIFENFARYKDVKKISDEFGIDFKVENITAEDVLRIFQDNVHYYKLKNTGEYEYTHITFCDMISQDKNAKHKMNEIETGMALEGLVSTVASINCGEDYRSGFGTKNILNEKNILISTATNLNELAANLDNQGKNPYRKDETIVAITSTLKEKMINEMYNSSHWVTFINPRVDLEFFQKHHTNLLIIHYNDQYTSSNYYDAITVTNKYQQFINIVKEYLNDFVSSNDEEINGAIKAFNSINGEWLLKMVGSKGQFAREKLSIVSAIKYTLGYLEHKNIIWIPISLEEILRVAGAVRLDRSSGIFSAKNLKVKGNISDDLLLMGLEVRDDESVYLHYYPVEVKVGINQENVILKAKDQINKTRATIDEQLLDEEYLNHEGEKKFLKKFFRNFFVQVFLLNAKKFEINEVWPEKSFDIIQRVAHKLLNDKYEIANNLNPIIGKGAVVSFRKDNAWRSANIEEDILVINLTEEDAYTGVVQNLEDIKNRIQQGKTDLNTGKLLSAIYNVDPVEVKDEEKDDEGIEEYADDVETIENTQVDVTNEEEYKVKNLKDIRILIGTMEGSNKKVYWQYGHEKLSNRHILISGKSGQGKSYFIQCLLMELSNFGISNIIIDYTDGFKKSQLEDEFKEVMKDRIQQFLVIKDKFPLNPFKINKKEIDEGEYINEDYSDVAERVKCIIGSIYKDLGAQQLNSIYQGTKRGLERYEGRMNLRLLQQELEEENTSYAKTVSAQLALLFDKDPFDYQNSFDWSDIDKDEGKVFIIQLTGFKREIQLIITEFILWDLWYYKLQYGNKDKPLPVILDEAQNLDHSKKSPSAKILTEGRKFGWSGWYATQFLRGQLSGDEIKRLENSSQVAYFLPSDSEIGAVAGNLSRDSSEKKVWERKLSSLKKGQCISQGLFIDDNGENKGDVAVVVDITPMEERVERLKLLEKSLKQGN